MGTLFSKPSQIPDAAAAAALVGQKRPPPQSQPPPKRQRVTRKRPPPTHPIYNSRPVSKLPPTPAAVPPIADATSVSDAPPPPPPPTHPIYNSRPVTKLPPTPVAMSPTTTTDAPPASDAPPPPPPPSSEAAVQPSGQASDQKPARDKRNTPRKDDDDRDEDIRGTYTPDAPVQSKYVLRAVRDPDTGALSLDTQGTPLYSPTFFEDWHARASALPPASPDGTHAGAAPRLSAGIECSKEQTNFLDHKLQRRLRKRDFPFPRADKVLSAWNDDAFEAGRLSGAFGEREVRAIDLRDKTYLAPLTTVGNLPFRRVCKRLGADVTCGEMAMAPNLLQGQKSEWALLRRHEEEDLFGVQLAGSNVETLTRASELVAEQCRLDFVEINCGCPIDIVFNRGGGCALMKRRTKLSRMVWSVAQAARLPVGVKVRTGVSPKARNAHEVILDVAQAGAQWVTVHGRSRKQRYSKLADWGYIIDECAPAAKRAGVMMLGNGDVYNWRDACKYFSGGERADAGVGSVMVARGALIKPWLFTEIKERRDWDISSRERLDIYRQFAKFGLDHWGADERGVATTRKFLLEWLSFLYRYVPIGLLEAGNESVVTMGHRAPFFRGRDELETLLGSPQGNDWVRITELLLGKAPAGFTFTPKHKSNAWDGGGDGGEAQG